MFYRLILRPILYLLPPETAHHLVIFLLRLAQACPGGKPLLTLLFSSRTAQPVSALGLQFPSAVGLAAGFDKDARIFPALFALGFGFVEVGTITAKPQPGNARPRLFRLVRDRALINRMGFNNLGAAAAATHLARVKRKPDVILGINIGKTKLVEPEHAADDYAESAKLLGPHADYLVVNVSSPNTPGLRDLQAVETLRPILLKVRATLDEVVTDRRVPLLVKIAPDLNDQDVIAVTRLVSEIALDGIIATNTTISREGLATPEVEVQALGSGGLSGAPLKTRSLEVLRLIRKVGGPELTLIAAGGIESAEDAAERLAAGAQLIQVYTALVYEGPSLAGRLVQALANKRA